MDTSDRMSWESLNSNHEYLRYEGVGHQLSATRLLSSPDGSRHPLDERDISWPWNNSYSSLHRESYMEVRTSRPPSLSIGCFRLCSNKIHQGIAKRKMEQGLKLYNQHKQQQAVRKWKSAINVIKKREDKFVLLGYLYQAYMDWGKYRDALEYAHQQLYISEELDNPNMRAESYLNLARSHQRLGGLERALAYARHSLYNECEQCSTSGHVHLTVGSVYLELAGFHKALESMQQAHRIAQAIHDPALELQKAFRQYKTAMGSAAALGDRVIQMESMDGAARCLEALRLQHKICNCRPLEFNTRLLEVASSVGAKMLVRTVRMRLSRIYSSLGDEEQKIHHERVASRLQIDLELICGACGECYGSDPDALEALPCAHVLHARCAYELFRRGKKKKQSCPECDRTSSRLYLNSVDPTYNHSPIPLSVCSSDCPSQQATSSV
ncbi:43 kDa receptor-associated protein of the synapse isoform X3 [Harmonia axyridis]|uniref:43 kDa receptor-associated protein of the synapse isoform X3 n=1 Tax=Harmonia axyridis TaxID=115357 RepID=UPI001E274FD9|nr:43 kDa receptor-associated protein of the synapse isoform X3 [Harmonia axyridis]